MGARRRAPRPAERRHRSGGARRSAWPPCSPPRQPSSAGPGSCRSPCSWPRRFAHRSPSTAPARSSSRSPTTAASAGCCRSTSCSRRRPPRSAGARCAADDLRAAPEDDRAPRGRVLRVRLLLAPVGRRRGGGHEPAAVLHAAVRRPAGDASRARRLPGLGAALARRHSRSGWARSSRRSGLWQAATHKLFFYAPNLAASNANTDYFSVTSLFGDPSLYGRHVMLGSAWRSRCSPRGAGARGR